MATKIAVMDRGVIQQFGTPDEIYEHPANLFVAGFIGSPAMNLKPATLKLANGSAIAESDGIRLDLSGYPFKTKPEDGAPIVLGLRPEHFGQPGEILPTAAGTVTLPVQYTERTGSDATAYLKHGETLLAVRVEPGRTLSLKQGEAVSVPFARGKANVFDANSGRRL